ncbi:glycosyltransferase [Agaribacter flavus]|uniref:Glycosyltransferase n=1 Tax=Agaribacter flavus TaxID=1902781 RepID=A0ABV7FN98_9ALTE
MPKKNVLHITYDMRIGGTEMVIKNIVNGLKLDVNMSLFCIEEPIGQWGKDLIEEGIPCHSFERREGFDWRLIVAIRKVINNKQIDIVHCHQYTPWVYGAIATFGTKARVLFTEHGRFYPDSSNWKRRLVNPLLSNMTKSITAISAATKQALVDYEFLSESKIKVVYNGIEKVIPSQDQVEIKRALDISEGKVVFGTIARLDPIKNQTMMLEAFANVISRGLDAILLVVGDGELMESLQQLAKRLDIEKRVIFTGYKPYPADYLNIMDVFLLSSLSEGTSMTLLEAMSLAKPSVVTDAGGNSEIIKHKVNGLVVPNDDQQAFADAMFGLASHIGLLNEYASNALKIYQEQFSSVTMNQQYLSIYGK